MGNSKWHGASFMGVAVLVCVAGILLTVFTIHEQFAAQRGLLFFLFVTSIVLLLSMIAKRVKSGKDDGFHDRRTQAFLLYVKNMFNGVQQKRLKASVQQWRKQYADSEQKRMEAAEAAGQSAGVCAAVRALRWGRGEGGRGVRTTVH